MESHPVSADVYLNGVHEGSTSLKLVIPSGRYTIGLKSTGYRSWQRTFGLDGGGIEQLVYPFLFPQKLVTADEQLYSSTPQMATQSPDRHWLLVQPPTGQSGFDEFDLTSTPAAQSQLKLPTGLLTADTGAHRLSVIEWSSDNRHVLLRHTFKGGFEYIIFDRAQPASSINLNQLFKISPTTVAMRNKHFDSLYFYDRKSQILSTANVKNKQIGALLHSVITFKPYGSNTILYVSTTKTKSKSAVKLWDGKNSYLLHNYQSNSDYKLDYASFSGHNYAVIAVTATGDVYIYKDPLQSVKQPGLPSLIRALKISQPQAVSFSANTRFIAAQSGSRFAVYDIDNDRGYKYTLKQQLPIAARAVWMDGHRLSQAADGKIMVFDFDGINQQILSATLPGFGAIFNPNYDELYSIAPSTVVPKRMALTRTGLKVQ